MKPVREPGKFASWIAPPRVGIDNKPGDFEYVKLAAERYRRLFRWMSQSSGLPELCEVPSRVTASRAGG